MCVTTTHINLTIKYIFLTCQPLSTPQNLPAARIQNPIYHPNKTINFLNKVIPSSSI